MPRAGRLFGRDVNGYILHTDEQARSIFDAVNADEWETVNQTMLDEGIGYLVTTKTTDGILDLVDTVAGYHIYKPIGVPAILKGRNELGQIVYMSTLDESGNLKNNELGYATIHREYDAFNRVIKEYKTDAEGNICKQCSGYSAICQEWNGEGQLISRTYLDERFLPVQRLDGYSKVEWTQDEKGIRKVSFIDINNNTVDSTGINLVQDVEVGPDGWSEWMTPEPDKANQTFNIGSVNLGEKSEGDVYACQLEIEFSNVMPSSSGQFRFITQGKADGLWNIGNVWNNVVKLEDKPKNGKSTYYATNKINGRMVDIDVFTIGFRCDYWASGSFRVRKVKIERGSQATQWDQGI